MDEEALLRDAVSWLVKSLAEGTDAEQVVSRVSSRLRDQSDIALALTRSPRFAGFRENPPVIDHVEMADAWTAVALVSTGPQRWELEVGMQPEPPHLIRRFSPRPIASDAIAWAEVADRLRGADRPAESALPASAADAIHERLVSEAGKRRLPGLAVGIAVNGQVVHREFLGLADIGGGTPITAESAFQLGSVTKLITALGVLALEAGERIDLDAPVGCYLPAPALVAPRSSDRLPAVRDLLLHTAGLPKDIVEVRRALQRGIPVADAVARIELVTEPGTRPAYSNLGYCLLGAMIERVTGQPLAQFLTAHVLSPLGMDTASLPVPGLTGPVDVTGYRLAAGTLAPAIPYVSPPGAGGATGRLSDALALATALAAGHDSLLRRAAQVTGPSSIPGARFCPGYAVASQDLPTGRRLLAAAPTAWKEGASDGFTAEITATVGREPAIALAILANKTPPDSFGQLSADLAAQL